jgi:hypothetical protein
MKKVVLSVLAFAAINVASANAMQFYTDKQGQVFTQPGEGRTALGPDTTPVTSHDLKLDFSGLIYFGYTYTDYSALDAGDYYSGYDTLGTADIPTSTKQGFQLRRNYIQAKAYFQDNPKNYFRVTLDTTADSSGNQLMLVKYAYLYLDNILPATGVEIGVVHRPWIDYEEHQGWWYRSVAKTFTESDWGAHDANSADFGVDFKTKTDYFTSELGVFNGEGYHTTGYSENGGMSYEWRLTGALMGNGTVKRKPTKTSYWDASFYGQYNVKNSANVKIGTQDGQTYSFYGLNTVFNVPSFLLSATYLSADNTNKDAEMKGYHYNGSGFSVNGEFRMGEEKQYRLFARYDNWTAEDPADVMPNSTDDFYIYGVAWEETSHVTWLLNGESYTSDKHIRSDGKTPVQDWNSVLATVQVEW